MTKTKAGLKNGDMLLLKIWWSDYIKDQTVADRRLWRYIKGLIKEDRNKRKLDAKIKKERARNARNLLVEFGGASAYGRLPKPYAGIYRSYVSNGTLGGTR